MRSIVAAIGVRAPSYAGSFTGRSPPSHRSFTFGEKTAALYGVSSREPEPAS